jgi:hypothetical protein
VGIMKPIMKGSRSLCCLVLGLGALLMAERAEADLLAVAPACVSGPLDAFLGTSCTIGNALFTFQESFSQGNFNNQNPPLSPTDILFSVDASDPFHPGFTLTGDFASVPINPTRVTAQALVFFYTVSPLSDLQMRGMDGSVGGVIISGTGYADAETFYCLGTFITFDPSQCAIVHPVVAIDGSSNPQSISFSGPFRLGSHVGETTFATFTFGGTVSFDTVSVHYSIPEPSALLLLGSGLIGWFGYAWRRRKHAA